MHIASFVQRRQLCRAFCAAFETEMNNPKQRDTLQQVIDTSNTPDLSSHHEGGIENSFAKDIVPRAQTIARIFSKEQINNTDFVAAMIQKAAPLEQAKTLRNILFTVPKT